FLSSVFYYSASHTLDLYTLSLHDALPILGYDRALDSDQGAGRAPLSFQDYFSDGARAYAAFRPRYPDALFAFLAGAVPRHDLAWDCATGSGQAAIGLARHFARVLASDAG